VRRLSVALEGRVHGPLARHLLRADGQEDVCFLPYHPSTGTARDTLILGEPILPFPDERHVHGNASIDSSYLLRAAQIAEDQGAGLALAHSHPLGVGWQGMSPDDIDTERGYAPQAGALTGFPLLGLTIAGDEAWSARRWQRAAHLRVPGRRERAQPRRGPADHL
jgi:hypothetical protein